MFIQNKLTPQMLEHDTANVMRTVACSNWAPRMCDTCRVATCTVFCRVDSAYLCAGCDVRVHAVNHVTSQHERVWVCEACERAPAEFLCKADAASLCSSCDADIHSANLLASRHHRVPIMPISGFLYGPPATQEGGFRGCRGGGGSEVEVDEEDDGVGVEDEDEAASWLLLNPMKNNNINNNNDQSNGFLFGGEVEEYLDLVDCNSCDGNNNNNQFNSGTEHYGQQNLHQEQQQHYGVPQKIYVGDSVVPVQQHQKGQHFQLGLEFESPKAGFSCNGSNSQSVSISSIDIGIVPESTMRDVSISHSRPPKGTIDLFSGPSIQMSCHLTPMDREARVLRYREKKKTRKFEKTIRYASRKAYAETRPRVKGRFAKRSNVEAEVDQIFSSSLITEVGYGIVPSF